MKIKLSRSQKKDNLKSFLNVRNSTMTEADLYFYGDIVSDWWGAWDDMDQYPEAILNFLKEHEGKRLNVYINSGGGSVFAGIAIYNMLKRHSGKVVVHIDSVAASIASVIALAGDEIHIPENAFMFIHKPWNRVEGNADELRAEADALDKIQDAVMTIYSEHLNNSDDAEIIREMVNKETWLTGSEAAKYFRIILDPPQNCAAKVTDLTRSYNGIPEQIINSANAAGNKSKRENLMRSIIESAAKGV